MKLFSRFGAVYLQHNDGRAYYWFNDQWKLSTFYDRHNRIPELYRIQLPLLSEYYQHKVLEYCLNVEA